MTKQKSKVTVSCNKCGLTGTIELDMPINELNVGGEINHNQPCPKCGGKFSAPGGRYKRDDAGLLVRIGDYVPHA